MANHENEANIEYQLGRGGVKLPLLEIKFSDYYPHDTVRFLDDLWKMNEINDVAIGQPKKKRDTGYFVVPGTQEKPTIFAFRETTLKPGQYDSPITTYQFLTPPVESGSFEQVMLFTHRSSRNSGFVSSRDTIALEDHEGHIVVSALYGYRMNGGYKPDEFVNYRDIGDYTYDDPSSQSSLKIFADKTNELIQLLS